jgi:hypothetical protein
LSENLRLLDVRLQERGFAELLFTRVTEELTRGPVMGLAKTGSAHSYDGDGYEDHSYGQVNPSARR